MKSASLFVLQIFGFTLILCCKADRRSYADNCDKTNRCDSQSSLTCIENKCQCLKPMEMIYDESVKKCLILLGEKCSFTLVESHTETLEETRVAETFDCVENATCNDEYCSCKPDFYEDTQGVCKQKRTNGENCTTDTECRNDLFFICQDGLCSCNSSEAVLNDKRCVAKAGLSCMKYGSCVPNADCGYYDKLCTCNVYGYEASVNGLCLGKYATSCDPIMSPCVHQFTCISGTCACHYPQHQSYNSSVEKCVSYVQSPCVKNVNGSVLQFSCVPNAECKTLDGISECICGDGYINLYDRQCYIAHGQPCDKSESCDPLPNLICRNGRCTCQDLHIYDKKRSLCIGLVGAECSMDFPDNFCITGSSCQSYRLNSSDWLPIQRRDHLAATGTCRCSKSYVSNSKRRCVPKLYDGISFKEQEYEETEEIDDDEL